MRKSWDELHLVEHHSIVLLPDQSPISLTVFQRSIYAESVWESITFTLDQILLCTCVVNINNVVNSSGIARLFKVFLLMFALSTFYVWKSEWAFIFWISDVCFRFLWFLDGNIAVISHWFHVVSMLSPGKIKDIVAEGMLNKLTRLVLVNAIYFKGTWNEPFLGIRTRDAQFKLNKVKLHKENTQWTPADKCQCVWETIW